MTTSLQLVKFRLGDRVERTDNPRHTGHVTFIGADLQVTVRWDNSWREDLHYSELRKICK